MSLWRKDPSHGDMNPRMSARPPRAERERATVLSSALARDSAGSCRRIHAEHCSGGTGSLIVAFNVINCNSYFWGENLSTGRGRVGWGNLGRWGNLGIVKTKYYCGKQASATVFLSK